MGWVSGSCCANRHIRWRNQFYAVFHNLKSRANEMSTVTAHAAYLIAAQLSSAHFAVAFQRSSLVALVSTYLDLNPVFLLYEIATTVVTSYKWVFSQIFAGKYRSVATYAHKSRCLVRQSISEFRVERLKRDYIYWNFALLLVVKHLNFAEFVCLV